MRHAHIFGAKGYYLEPSADRQKLDDDARACFFLGVLPDGDGVRVIDVNSRRIVKTRDVSFRDEPVTFNDSDQSSTRDINQESSWVFPKSNTSDGEEARHQQEPAQEQMDEDHRSPTPEHQNPPRQPRERRQPNWFGNPVAYSTSLANSPTYRTAMKSDEHESWREAMQAEINSFIKRKVFTLVPRPAGCKPYHVNGI